MRLEAGKVESSSVDKQAEDADKLKTQKSVATRRSVIDATIQCFIEIGYFRTTTTEIAKRAKLTRGAVQYYFPTTPDVLSASIDHLLEEWMDTYYTALREISSEEDQLSRSIDVYWRFVRHPLFIAWQELVAASRTEPELAEIIESAAEVYERRRLEAGRDLYPEHMRSAGDNFELGRDLSRVVLEGLALTRLTYDREEREDAIVELLKNTVRSLWHLDDPKR